MEEDMFNKNSNYALNKRDPDAIVCSSVTGVHIRLTRQDFHSEEEFLAWKRWSDQDLHEEENANHEYANHTTSLESLAEAAVIAPSAEQTMELRWDRRRHLYHTAETVRIVRHVLTQRQFRRLWLYCVKGLTQQQIGAMEGVGQQRVSKSLKAAEKKIKKFFRRAENRG